MSFLKAISQPWHSIRALYGDQPNYRAHFERELSFLISNTNRPEIIDPSISLLISTQTSNKSPGLPQIKEILQTSNHYILITEDCLQGTLLNYLKNYGSVLTEQNIKIFFVQIYLAYNTYYMPVITNAIPDRDFNINKIMISKQNLTVLDFGLESIRKTANSKVPFEQKLAQLIYQIIFKKRIKLNNRQVVFPDLPIISLKLREIIQFLMVNQLKWDQIIDHEFFRQEFYQEQILKLPLTLQKYDQPPDFRVKQSPYRAHLPIQFQVTERETFQKKQETPVKREVQRAQVGFAQYLNQSSNSVSNRLSQKIINRSVQKQQIVLETKIIKVGDHSYKDHFDRIKKSLSPIRYISPLNQSQVNSQIKTDNNSSFIDYQVQRRQSKLQQNVLAQQNMTQKIWRISDKKSMNLTQLSHTPQSHQSPHQLQESHSFRVGPSPRRYVQPIQRSSLNQKQDNQNEKITNNFYQSQLFQRGNSDYEYKEDVIQGSQYKQDSPTKGVTPNSNRKEAIDNSNGFVEISENNGKIKTSTQTNTTITYEICNRKPSRQPSESKSKVSQHKIGLTLSDDSDKEKDEKQQIFNQVEGIEQTQSIKFGDDNLSEVQGQRNESKQISLEDIRQSFGQQVQNTESNQNQARQADYPTNTTDAIIFRGYRSYSQRVQNQPIRIFVQQQSLDKRITKIPQSNNTNSSIQKISILRPTSSKITNFAGDRSFNQQDQKDSQTASISKSISPPNQISIQQSKKQSINQSSQEYVASHKQSDISTPQRKQSSICVASPDQNISEHIESSEIIQSKAQSRQNSTQNKVNSQRQSIQESEGAKLKIQQLYHEQSEDPQSNQISKRQSAVNSVLSQQTSMKYSVNQSEQVENYHDATYNPEQTILEGKLQIQKISPKNSPQSQYQTYRTGSFNNPENPEKEISEKFQSDEEQDLEQGDPQKQPYLDNDIVEYQYEQELTDEQLQQSLHKDMTTQEDSQLKQQVNQKIQSSNRQSIQVVNQEAEQMVNPYEYIKSKKLITYGDQIIESQFDGEQKDTPHQKYTESTFDRNQEQIGQQQLNDAHIQSNQSSNSEKTVDTKNQGTKLLKLKLPEEYVENAFPNSPQQSMKSLSAKRKIRSQKVLEPAPVSQEVLELAAKYQEQIHKYDLIGKTAVQCIKHFQAQKNLWIIPLFIVFKRMVFFRREMELRFPYVNLLFIAEDLFTQFQQSETLQELIDKVREENTIIQRECDTLHGLAKKMLEKLDPKEIKKIERFISQDYNDDVKDAYFIYFYAQIYKTYRHQTKDNITVDQVKLAINILCCLIISEQPFFQDDPIQFDLNDHDQNMKVVEIKALENYRIEKEMIVEKMKERLTKKGVKI